MSWDLFIQDLPAGISTVDEIPDSFEPAPLGSRAVLLARIRELEPTVDFSDPSWGQLAGEGYDIEFNMGTDETVSSFALHVRGDQRAMYTVHRLLEALQLRALDPSSSTGLFSLVDGAAEGFHRWEAYRNQVVAGQQP